MQRTIKMAAVAAVAMAAGTAGAFATDYNYGYGGYGYDGAAIGHSRYDDSYAWAPGPAYEEGYVAVQGPPVYYRPYGPGYGRYGNGTNHPTPSSSQGDVGPGGNNNGTLSGPARWQPW